MGCSLFTTFLNDVLFQNNRVHVEHGQDDGNNHGSDHQTNTNGQNRLQYRGQLLGSFVAFGLVQEVR